MNELSERLVKHDLTRTSFRGLIRAVRHVDGRVGYDVSP